MLSIILNLKRHHRLLFFLAVQEIRKKYAGTLGAWLWATVMPAATCLVFYVVFGLGFKATGPGNISFIAYFVSGYVTWIYFNAALIGATTTIISNAGIIKKTTFPSEILVVATIVGETIQHIIFFAISLIVIVMSDISIGLSLLWFIYYYICLTMLLIGAGWLFSAIATYARDVVHILSISLNMLFWLTPIVWHKEMLPDSVAFIDVANPLIYVIDGYRYALIGDPAFAPDALSATVFWTTTLTILAAGSYVFERSKHGFADQL